MTHHINHGIKRAPEPYNAQQGDNEKPNFFFLFSRKVPSLLEYFSYLFHYSTILVGPVCTFKDFSDFINGSDIISKVRQWYQFVISSILLSLSRTL